MMKDRILRRVNTGLSVVALGLALYIMLAPFIPYVSFWVASAQSEPSALTQQSIDDDVANDPMPAENMLLIPSIQLEEVIHDGATARTLEKGAWHRPHTSTPHTGSNTVIVGHRFTYSQPKGVFYHLDKVALGDVIIVYWEQQKYQYVVQDISVVKPTAVAIEGPTEETTLTLYTCTPLWSAKDRLVVRATLSEVAP